MEEVNVRGSGGGGGGSGWSIGRSAEQTRVVTLRRTRPYLYPPTPMPTPTQRTGRFADWQSCRAVALGETLEVPYPE